MSNDKKTNDLFDMGSSEGNLFESSAKDGMFPDTVANPFEKTDSAAPIIEIKEEAPVIPVTEDKKEKKNTKSNRSKTDKKALSQNIKTQKKKRESMKVDKTWNIAYAANQYNPPEDDMTLDEVRQWLELDYPELSKERCRMEVNEEKKLIIPIVSGAKKG
ncbi:MoaD/ThiS family protein [Bacillus subtilis]|uniref:MoaD/ThiS family protein n=1 Tax=Bacillus subtilis TaxID=1423 RepID=UPI0021D9739F|nr:MoaD/ThiS family protein [Bacillus subtilis]